MMATIGALPPLHTTYLIIVTLCVSMRIYTRHFVSYQLGWDDCKSPLPVVIQ